jgi:hypothetical protein
LSLKAILDPKSTLRLIEIKETTDNNKVVTLNNYNNNIIIINISCNKNEESKI